MPIKNKTKRRWVPKSFSVDKADMPIFKRLAREASESQPKVSESALLVQILKDHYYVIDQTRMHLNGVEEESTA